MCRASLLVVGLSIFVADRAWAQPGPILEPASGAAQSPTPVETLPLGPLDRVEQAPAAAAPTATAENAATAENWRYRWHQGRWWYYMPNEQWVYWNGTNWLETAAAGQAASDPRRAPGLMFEYRGPAPYFGPPPYPGMPRYVGSPPGVYNGRVIRGGNYGWANGFIRMSGPPFPGYGYGMGGMQPTYGW